ncbi:hypothetical protein ADIWIN_1583 [Winogradskyella psychrotolerans RS-3]|uniref:Uncharacterized protein n=1 Tax=Winogradskyella psychrotolerans RS-3 TaxID=641526 RepID=S7XC18_9FLAO|nr:DUF4421 family protein [Winogradskyella psychrotolerans]EPR73553.1 hypothetical protein ADIWIN_1583 [Winogradskyella psychrotolerans RS-3]
MDSLLVDRDIENYSLRVFSNFKVNKFSISDDDSKAKFVPNNRYGLGLGFATKKIILDIAVNIKNPNKEKTSRFDLQATTILKDQNYVKIYTQVYRGFNAKNNFDEPTVFRDDIRSVSVGLNYMYTLDDIEFSYSQLKAGLSNKNDDNIFITGGVGLFGSFDYFSAKPSILSETTSPYFSDEGDIKRYQGLSFGVLAGLISYFKLPENITATVNVMPGIGLVNKKLTLQDGSYKPSNPMLYKLDFLVGLSYNFKQYYVSLSYSNDLYSTDFDYGNNYLLNLTKAKLAIGYKFNKRNK